MLIQAKASIVWGLVALVSTFLLILEQPRDPKHWTLVLVAIGSVALAVYAWKGPR